MLIKFALHDDDVSLTPVQAHPEDACYDLFARAFARPEAPTDETDALLLAAGERCLAKSGVYVEMEPGWEALVRPRSGNALKLGLTILNTPGTIDAGYRNEIGVILHNAGGKMIELRRGMRVAQIAFRPIPQYRLERISRAEFDADTRRGLKGFGSSGL